MHVRACVRVRACVCVHVRVRVCVCACARVCVLFFGDAASKPAISASSCLFRNLHRVVSFRRPSVTSADWLEFLDLKECFCGAVKHSFKPKLGLFTVEPSVHVYVSMCVLTSVAQTSF